MEEGIDDTEMTAGREAHQAALVFYHSAKAAAARDIPGAKAVYAARKTRFPQTSRRRAASKTGSAKTEPCFTLRPGSSPRRELNSVQSRIAGVRKSQP
jgi:hypothetical protein